MHWIAPSEKDADAATLEKRLCDTADPLGARAGLKQSEYSEPVLNLIFQPFVAQRASLKASYDVPGQINHR